jgi:hypothetical protein
LKGVAKETISKGLKETGDKGLYPHNQYSRINMEQHHLSAIKVVDMCYVDTCNNYDSISMKLGADTGNKPEQVDYLSA